MTYLKTLLSLCACFLMVSAGVLLLQLRSDAVHIAASIQQTLSSAQATLGHIDEDAKTANSVLRTANGAINNARDILRDEKASIKQANDQTIETMDNLNKLVQNLDASQKQVVANVADTLKAVQTTTSSVAPVMQQAQKDLAALEPIIAQSQVAMDNVNKTTTDVAAEVHKFVYPPPQKWWQKVWGPMKLIMHMVTVPI